MHVQVMKSNYSVNCGQRHFLIRGAGNWKKCYSGNAVAPLVFLFYYNILLNTKTWWGIDRQ